MKRGLFLLAFSALGILVAALWRGAPHGDGALAVRLLAEAQTAPAAAEEVAALVEESPERRLPAPVTPPRSDVGNEEESSVSVAAPSKTYALLRVRVVSLEAGEGFARVGVSVHGGGARSRRDFVLGSLFGINEQLTDEEGKAEFTLPADEDGEDWLIELDTPGFDDRKPVKALRAWERREVTLEIPTGPDLRMWVQVVETADVAPLPGAEIVVTEDCPDARPWSERRKHARPVTLTDATGRAELRGRSWCNPRGDVSLAGHGALRFVLDEGHETPEKALLLPLSITARLRGRIMGPPNEPPEGLRVWLTDSYEEWNAWVSPEGAFELDDLPSCVPLQADVRRGQRVVYKEPQPLVLTAGETREVEWHFGPGCTLNGIVVDQTGEPVPLALIQLMAGEVRSYYDSYDDVHEATKADDEGRFVFEHVLPGIWSVGPLAREGWYEEPSPDALARVALVVEVLPHEIQREVVLEVFRGLYVRGHVLDAAGAPVEKEGRVYGSSPQGSIEAYVPEEDPGEFVLGPLAAGPLRLLADDFAGFSPSPPVDVQAGDEGIELHLQRGGSLSGTVVDAETGAAVEALVFLSDGGAEPGSLVHGGTEAGVFRFEGVRPGNHHLAATTEEGKVGVLRNVSVRADGVSTGLVIPVASGATLCVRSEDPRIRGFVLRSEGAIVANVALGEAPSEACVAAPSGPILVQALKLSTTASLSGGEVEWVERELTLAAGERQEIVSRGKNEGQRES